MKHVLQFTNCREVCFNVEPNQELLGWDVMRSLTNTDCFLYFIIRIFSHYYCLHVDFYRVWLFLVHNYDVCLMSVTYKSAKMRHDRPVWSHEGALKQSDTHLVPYLGDEKIEIGPFRPPSRNQRRLVNCEVFSKSCEDVKLPIWSGKEMLPKNSILEASGGKIC